MRGIIVVLLLIIGSISGFGSTFSVTTTADGLTCRDSGDTSAACMVQDPPYQTPFTVSGAQAQVTVRYGDPYRSFLYGSFSDFTFTYGHSVGYFAHDNIKVQFTVPTYWGDFEIGNFPGGGYSEDTTDEQTYDLMSFDSGECFFRPNDSLTTPSCVFSHVEGTQQTVTMGLDSSATGYYYDVYGGFRLAITDLGPPITTPEPATFALTGLFSLAAAMTYFFRTRRNFKA